MAHRRSMRRLVLVFAVVVVVGCGGSQLPTGSGDMVQMGGASDGGLAPFGAVCTMNAQCMSNACFVGGNRSFCSLHCTAATQATDCPTPATSGVCNMMGYCKP